MKTIFFIDSNERLLSTYISGEDEFTVDKNDAGYGILWVDVTIEGRNIFMQVDTNNTGGFRSINLLVENVAKTKTIDIIINQDADDPSYRFYIAGNSQYIPLI